MAHICRRRCPGKENTWRASEAERGENQLLFSQPRSFPPNRHNRRTDSCTRTKEGQSGCRSAYNCEILSSLQRFEMRVVTMKGYAKQNAACYKIKGTAVSQFDKEVDEALDKGEQDSKKCNHPTKD